MSTRRSFLVSACLIAALALFGVAEAQAQVDGKVSFPKSPTGGPVVFFVTESETVDLPLEVRATTAAGAEPTASTVALTITGGFGLVMLPAAEMDQVDTQEDSAFSFYGPGFNVNDASGAVSLTVNDDDRRAVLTAASIQDRNGDNEVATVRIFVEDLMMGGMPIAYVVVIDDARPSVEFALEMDEVLEGTRAEVKLTGDLGPEFTHNDFLATLRVDEMGGGKDRKVQLLSGDVSDGAKYSYDSDGRLVINLSNVGNQKSYNFMVEMLDDPDGSHDEVVLLLSHDGPGLQLGDMTEMTLKIIDDDEDAPKRDDDEDEDDETTPTPALPLFGAIALAGALATAGRRRMRQLRAARERKLLV